MSHQPGPVTRASGLTWGPPSDLRHRPSVALTNLNEGQRRPWWACSPTIWVNISAPGLRASGIMTQTISAPGSLDFTLFYDLILSFYFTISLSSTYMSVYFTLFQIFYFILSCYYLFWFWIFSLRCNPHVSASAVLSAPPRACLPRGHLGRQTFLRTGQRPSPPDTLQVPAGPFPGGSRRHSSVGQPRGGGDTELGDTQDCPILWPHPPVG